MKFYVLVFLQTKFETLFIVSNKYENQWNALGGEISKYSDDLSVTEAVHKVLYYEGGIALLQGHPEPELFAHLRSDDYCVFCYRVAPFTDWMNIDLSVRKEPGRMTAWYDDEDAMHVDNAIAFAPHMAELIRLSRLPVDGDIVPSIVD